MSKKPFSCIECGVTGGHMGRGLCVTCYGRITARERALANPTLARDIGRKRREQHRKEYNEYHREYYHRVLKKKKVEE
jgi:hypothetical protein